MKCHQVNCEKEATHVVYWPGQLTYQCEEHKDKAVSIGKFLGFDVSTALIDVKEMDE